MKITNIKKLGNILYSVTFKPCWLQRMFGMGEVTKEYTDIGGVYTKGGGHAYINSNGRQLLPTSKVGKAIDKHRKRL